MRWLLLVVFSCLLSSTAVAQEGPTMAVWTGQLMTLDLDADQDAGLKMWLDLHQRQVPNTFVAIVRPGVGWDTGKGVSVWAGYGWIPTWDGEVLRNENRIWQQVIGKTNLRALGLMGRVRLEQRLLEGAPELGHRVRGFARAGLRINEFYGLSLWDEAFVHLNNTSFSRVGFNQNRLFFGPYIKAGTGWRTEFGYLNVTVNTEDALVVNHTLAMNLFLPFQPSK